MRTKVYFSKRPRFKNPLLIAAWPGIGEVALKSASYLRDALFCEEFGYIMAPDFFSPDITFVNKGIIEAPLPPLGRFFYAKDKDIVIFISQDQPDTTKAQAYCNILIDTIKALGIKQVFSFGAMPVPIDHTQEPSVWGCATSERMLEALKKFKIEILKEGSISGLNGIFQGIAKERGIEGICLLGGIPIYTLQMYNPKASLAVLKALTNILNLKIDFTKLIEEINKTETEISRLLDYLKGQESFDTNIIKEEDIRLFKDMLANYTKLPKSARGNIERLFKEAKENIKKAAELKSELDKWNVYKDFEDRFLDLFKNQKKEK